MKIQCLFDIVLHRYLLSDVDELIRMRADDQWKSYSTGDVMDEIRKAANLLIGLDLNKGDMIIVVPELASAQAFFVDMAAQILGITVVLVHSTTKASQFHSILNETQVEVLFFKNELLLKKFQSQLNNNHRCFLLNQSNEPDASISDKSAISRSQVIDMAGSISESDLSTIIYTSGTTGDAKGVMLTHRNIVSNVMCAAPLLPLKKGDRTLNFLPYSHAFERTSIFSALACGAVVCMAYDRLVLEKAFIEIQPHVIAVVPRILERMYNSIFAHVEERKFLNKRLLKWAVTFGSKYESKYYWNPLTVLKLGFIRRVVFGKLRRKLGQNLRVIIAGAAYLNPSLSRFFSAAGIPIREGYGLTEGSPIVTINRMNPGLNRFGTVGLPLPGVRIKINEANESGIGEILVKGPNIMKGYYKRPDDTAKVFDKDGWFLTGDVGQLVDDKFLKITDRKKDIFKTSLGKYVAPQVVESMFKSSHFIDQILVVGFHRPYLTAIIHPNFILLEKWSKQNKIHWTSNKYMVLNLKINQKIQFEINLINAKVPSHERIRKFVLSDEEFSIENGLLSNTLKPIRNNIVKLYSVELDGLYEKG